MHSNPAGKRHSLSAGLAALALLLLFLAPARAQEASKTSVAEPVPEGRRYSLTERRVVKWESGKPVTLEESDGSIIIRGGRSEDIEIIAIITAFAQDIETARRNVSLVSLDIEAPRDGIVIGTQKPVHWTGGARARIDYSVDAPKDIDAVLKTITGDIDATGIDGTLSARTSSGTIFFKNDMGHASAFTEKGNIKVIASPGLAEASSKSGDIKCVFPDAPESKEISITTETGGVEFTFPRGTPLTFEIRTDSGDIDVFDAALEKSEDIKLDGETGNFVKAVRYTSAGGGPLVRISTTSGKILINNPAPVEEGYKKHRWE